MSVPSSTEARARPAQFCDQPSLAAADSVQWLKRRSSVSHTKLARYLRLWVRHEMPILARRVEQAVHARTGQYSAGGWHSFAWRVCEGGFFTPHSSALLHCPLFDSPAVSALGSAVRRVHPFKVARRTSLRTCAQITRVVSLCIFGLAGLLHHKAWLTCVSSRFVYIHGRITVQDMHPHTHL